MTTSSSPLETALEQLISRAWLVKSLTRSEFNTVRPWSCELFPGCFKTPYYGRRDTSGGYIVYVNPMTFIVADGRTAAEAVTNAIAALDKSPVKAVYERFIKAVADNLDAIQKAGNSR